MLFIVQGDQKNIA